MFYWTMDTSTTNCRETTTGECMRYDLIVACAVILGLSGFIGYDKYWPKPACGEINASVTQLGGVVYLLLDITAAHQLADREQALAAGKCRL